jgi:ADP-ribosylglycohydrolase
MNEITREDRIKGIFFGGLVGDALCLGSHYEYDAKKIYAAYGNQNISRFMSPGELMGGQTNGIGWGEQNYHPGKKAGGTTDYGDYNILILEHLSKNANPPKAFEVKDILAHWMNRLEHSWGSWICTMTRETYSQVKQGVSPENLGGRSNATAIRSLATFAYWNDEETLVEVSKQMMFTHRDFEALGGAEFFTKIAFRVLNGKDPREAIEEVAILMGGFFEQKTRQAIQKYDEAINPDSALNKEQFCDDLAITSMAKLWDVGRSEPIKVGKASPTQGTLPSAIYFILKYYQNEEGLKEALIANTMVGGDNASRAIAIGMVLGAYKGVNKIPKEWKETLTQWKYCEEMLNELPLLK